MPLEAKRFRHVAVAIPEVRISRGIAVSPRQQSLQPQQPDLVQNKSGLGWHHCQPVDGRLRFLQVGGCASAQQGFYQNGDGRRATNQVAGGEIPFEGNPRQFDRAVEFAGSGLLFGENGVDPRHREHGEALLHSGFSGRGKQGQAVAALGTVVGHERETAHVSRARQREIVAGSLRDLKQLSRLVQSCRTRQHHAVRDGDNVSE